ncbi:MAG: putative metal-binding motif-containing protein [Deltaproteobacteria bacterium]|nr:putative metal-binding motif-containing protein [Deltaproteobacteria bacterium]
MTQPHANWGRTVERLVAVSVVWAAAACSATADDYVVEDIRREAADDGGGGADADVAADGDEDAVGPDADGGDDVGETGDAEDDAPVCTLGWFGDRCTVHADCCPGLVCFSPLEDSRPSICTTWCTDDECPEGFACRVFSDGSGGEARVCWYPAETMCNACEENAECGEGRDLCMGMPGPGDPTFCSIFCDVADPDGCPAGFTCTEITTMEVPTFQCMPDDGVCCIDRDGDDYGQGDGCLGTDCNDGNPAINPGAEELCDGLDNDCDTGVDNGPNACGLCRQCIGGSCVDVAAGADPYEECGAVGCDAYYWGWADTTNTCFHMGSVPATLAACNGSAACRTVEEECNLHRLMGTEQVTCTGTLGVCQTREGCVGTEAGRCVDQDLGTLTCGLGECTRSVARCVAGVEQSCVPGLARAETCNDLDDDCDGVTDVSSTFATHGHEPNDSCGALTDLGAIQAPVTGMSVSDAPTLYPGGDLDYFTLLAQEPTDSPIECIPLLCIENYELTITLTRPADGTAFQLCASRDACASQSCTTGNTRTITWTGTCGGNDDRRIWFSVRSLDAASFDCHPYEVRIVFRAWLSDGSWPGCPGV